MTSVKKGIKLHVANIGHRSTEQKLNKSLTKVVEKKHKSSTKVAQKLHKSCTKVLQKLYKSCI